MKVFVGVERGVSTEQIVAEAVAAHLRAVPGGTDSLEAFIASRSSGRGDLARRHREIRAEPTEINAARNL